MSRRFARQGDGSRDSVSVIKLDKSGGCVDRDAQYTQQSLQAQIREYFFGDVRNPLSPHTQQIDLHEVVIYRHAEREPYSSLPSFSNRTNIPRIEHAILPTSWRRSRGSWHYRDF